MSGTWSLFTLFQRAAEKYPGRTAIRFPHAAYTYQELYQHVAAVYQLLVASQVADHRIGVYCTGDIGTYSAVLAIAAYGSAYFPLNPAFPDEHNLGILEKSDVRRILYEGDLPGLAAKCKDKVSFIKINEKDILPGSQEHGFLPEKINQQEAYLLFTSGSTGSPKGVPVQKTAVQAFFDFYLDPVRYDFRPQDRFLQVYELSFDVSVFSIFLPLYTGACCVIMPGGGIRWLQILRLLQDLEISVVSMVPSVLQFCEKYLDELRLPKLRYSFFSGDKLYHHLACKWKSCAVNGVIHNFYGPTETTIVCTRYIWEEQMAARESLHGIVPLGTPFPGMEYVLLDDNDQIIHKTAEPGELCFAGIQTIPAYLNGEHSNQFIDIHQVGTARTYYRTGDLANMNDRGILIFCGRKDRQVKINGFRVELGEVDHCLKQITGKFAASLAVPDETGMPVLISFIEGTRDDLAGLMSDLRRKLPAYMIPRTIVYLEKMPLSPNGKLDMQALDRMAKTLKG
ncbi:MAG TPA: AMP-binding protein [Chitinophagaceae bacterium]|nr:AMP-binding protein [Chitinophagaceae bacterium]